MLKNKKGQALVEFVIILPVLIMIVFCLIDFGRIFYTKNNLEGTMDKVVEMYNDNETHENILAYLEKNTSDVSLKITNEDNKYIEITVGKKVDIITPGLKTILPDDYEATVKRVLPYE